MKMTDKPQRVLLSGARGNLATAFTTYMKREHPEVEVVPLLPFPCSFQSLADHLKTKTFTHLINLAGKGENQASFRNPYDYYESNVICPLKQLESIRLHSPATRFLNVGSVYEFSDKQSPYISSKRAIREIVTSYRRDLGLYAVTATLSNTEYYHRNPSYLARRITMGVARIAAAIKKGESFEPLVLGDIDQKFSWVWAEDATDGIWRMVNQEVFRTHRTDGSIHCVNEPFEVSRSILHDYILVSDVSHTLREFVEKAFEEAGFEGDWIVGKTPQDERFDLYTLTTEDQTSHVDIDLKTYEGVVRINPTFYRTNEVDLLWGDSSRARTELNWTPKYSFQDLVREMVAHDLREVGL